MVRTRSFVTASICAALLTACSQTLIDTQKDAKRGKVVYTKECSQCHGTRGEGGGAASLGLGAIPPNLVGLEQRNDGAFPREFVRRFIMGQLAKDDPDSAMPDFASVGLRHVYPNGGSDAEVLRADFEALLDYLETIQE